jgi:tetratricopeptide (TPR) repeat protein
MKQRITATLLSLVLAGLCLAAGVPVAYAQEGATSYEMSIVFDRSYGDLVSRGSFERAIVKINRSHDHYPFATATNLCVAHTMVGQYKHAEHYCDKALEEAKKAAAQGRRKSRDYTAEWAMAYSNRGVLRARIGDDAAAEQDFRMAIEKQAGQDLPIHNLAVLKQEASEVYVQGPKVQPKK